MANEVEMQALELYATISQMDKSIVGTDMDFSRWQYDTCYLSQGVNSDGIMVDILMDKIEQHKANGWKHKHSKNVSSNKLCILIPIQGVEQCVVILIGKPMDIRTGFPDVP